MIDSMWIIMSPSASRDAVQTALWQFGYVPRIFESIPDAFEQLCKKTPKVVIFRDEPPYLCRALIRMLRGLPVVSIVVLDSHERSTDWRWLETGADDFLSAPVTVESAMHGLDRHILPLRAGLAPRPQSVYVDELSLSLASKMKPNC